MKQEDKYTKDFLSSPEYMLYRYNASEIKVSIEEAAKDYQTRTGKIAKKKAYTDPEKHKANVSSATLPQLKDMQSLYAIRYRDEFSRVTKYVSSIQTLPCGSDLIQLTRHLHNAMNFTYRQLESHPELRKLGSEYSIVKWH